MAREALNATCPQCGGPVRAPHGAAYARCPQCSATSFLDLTGALLHQVIPAAIDRSRVAGLVWTAAGAAGWTEATLTGLAFRYEPVWELECTDGSRLGVSARPGPRGRFAPVRLPDGEREYVEPGERDRAATWLEPELAPESVTEVAARVTGRPVMVKLVRLVHRPIYAGRLQLAGAGDDFRLDAVTGELLDMDWPMPVSFRGRNLTWAATALMLAAAALLPLYWAVPAVLAAAGSAAWALSRQTRPAARPRP